MKTDPTRWIDADFCWKTIPVKDPQRGPCLQSNQKQWVTTQKKNPYYEKLLLDKHGNIECFGEYYANWCVNERLEIQTHI